MALPRLDSPAGGGDGFGGVVVVREVVESRRGLRLRRR